jgi:uncharacterized protein (TIGR02147 family)
VNNELYKYQNYKKFVKEWVRALPKSGHGFYRRLSLKLHVSTTLLSQVFNGDKQISLELAYEVATHLGLNQKEAEYFILLVEYEKAGSQKLKDLFLRKIKSIQQEHKNLEKKIEVDFELTENVKSIFYSDWIYTGVRNLIAIEKFANIHLLAQRLNLAPERLREIIDFLVQYGFCTRKEDLLKIGPQKTFISKDSPWVQQHHQNWRIKALEKMPLRDSNNLFYTGPMSMSEDVAQRIQDELPEFLARIYKWIGPSSSQTARCLNIDWFEY